MKKIESKSFKIKSKMLFFLFFCFFIHSFLLCAEIDYKITNILSIPTDIYTRVRIVLNNYLVIENIKLFDNGMIDFPSYNSKNDYTYDQIIFVDLNLEKYILNMIKLDKEEPYAFDSKNREYPNSKRLANVEILLDKKIVIILGVMKANKGEEWISYPVMKVGNKYYKTIYFLDKNLKEKIERDILLEFKKNRKISDKERILRKEKKVQSNIKIY